MRRGWIVSAAVFFLGIVTFGCGGGGGGGGGDDPPPPPVWSSEGIVWTAPYSSTSTEFQSDIQYKKIGNLVHLKGLANAGETRVHSGQVILTLPPGNRPPNMVALLCPTWGWPTGHEGGYIGTAGVFVFADGDVVIESVQEHDGEYQFLYLDGQSFSTVKSAEGWTNAGIVWNSSYSPGGPAPSTLEYTKTGTTVRLRGMANAGLEAVMLEEGKVICTLPEGFRPPSTKAVYLLCPTLGWPTGHYLGYIGTAGVFVFPDGSVIVKTVQQFPGEMQIVFFDGLSFSTVTGTDGWTNTGFAWNTPYTTSNPYPSDLEFNMTDDFVSLKGLANAGGTHVLEGQIIGSLPEGFRPPAYSSTRTLLCPTWGWPTGHPEGYIGTAGVHVFPDGTLNIKTVQQYNGQQQFLALDAKSYSTLN